MRIELNLKGFFTVGIDMPEDKWPSFIKACCIRFMQFSHEEGTACIGCVANSAIETLVILMKQGEADDYRQGLIELFVGMNIMHTGTFPKQADMVIDMQEIADAYSHVEDGEPEEDEVEPEVEETQKPSLNDVFKKLID